MFLSQRDAGMMAGIQAGVCGTSTEGCRLKWNAGVKGVSNNLERAIVDLDNKASYRSSKRPERSRHVPRRALASFPVDRPRHGTVNLHQTSRQSPSHDRRTKGPVNRAAGKTNGDEWGFPDERGDRNALRATKT